MANLSNRNIKFLGFAGIGVLAVGGIALGVVPLVGQLGGSNEDIDQAKSQTTELQTQITSLRGSQANEDKVNDFKTAFVKQFPETAQVPDLINAISSAAVTAGIPASDITNYGFQAPTVGTAATTPGGTPTPAASGAATSATASTPAPTASASGAATGTGAAGSGTAGTGTLGATTGQSASLTVNLTVQGNTRKFATFLKNVTNMDRNFTVTTFAVAGGTQNNPDTLTLTAKTYLYSHIVTPEESKSGSTASGTATGGATTGAGALPAPAPTTATR